MNNIDLETELAYLWALKIREFKIDLWKHTISFVLDNYKVDDTVETVLLVIKGVSAFFFINNSGEKRLRTNDWENAEISEMHYLEEGMDKIFYKDSKVNFPNYKATVNIYIEIWSSLLLIEAKAVEINGVEIQLK